MPMDTVFFSLRVTAPDPDVARVSVGSIDAVEAVVSGTLENGLTYLEVIGEQGQPRIARIHVKLFVAAGDVVATRTLFEHMLDRLPLVCTLRAALALTTELILTS
jgi:hypothetical protein